MRVTFDRLPQCRCGRPSVGILRGAAGQTVGHACRACGDRLAGKVPGGTPDLFDAPTGAPAGPAGGRNEVPRGDATGEGLKALAATAAANAAIIEKLVPVAQALARDPVGADEGVTVTDLRIKGVELGILTGRETGRRLSFLGAVMKRAGLKNTGQQRRSTIKATHGIRQTIWRLP